MGQRYRRGFTAAEKTELWERWQQGEFAAGSLLGSHMRGTDTTAWSSVKPQHAQICAVVPRVRPLSPNVLSSNKMLPGATYPGAFYTGTRVLRSVT